MFRVLVPGNMEKNRATFSFLLNVAIKPRETAWQRYPRSLKGNSSWIEKKKYQYAN
jgi:hypothetical protein